MSNNVPPESNPEPLLDNNRAHDKDMGGDSPPSINVNLQLIDETIIYYLTDTINPVVTKGDQKVSVPVIYANPEWWKTFQRDKFFRDKQNRDLEPPVITIRRTDITRGQLSNPNNKYVHKTFTKQWNRRNVYDRFAVQNRITPSMQMRQVIIPDYINITYQILIWTDYEIQLNEIIEQINVENDEFWGNRNQYKFRVKIDQYNSESELPTVGERVARASFNMEVAAYLLPEEAIRNFQPMSTNQDIHTRKKVVTIVEIEKTGE